MSKMGLHIMFKYLKHKLWLKQGPRVKVPIIALIYLHASGMPHTLEISQQGLQLYFRPHLNPKSAQKVMGLQSYESPNFENFKTPNLRVPRQNDIWV
jgi:hypothetical protein